MITIANFVGTFKVTLATHRGSRPNQVAVNDRVYIGTGTYGDSKPALDPLTGIVRVGVALVSEQGLRKLPEVGTSTPALFDFNGVYLTYSDQLDGQIPIFYQIGYATDGGTSIFGLTTIGDPDDVGVWGADDTAGGPLPGPGREPRKG